MKSFLSPKVEERESSVHGRGLFATEKIGAGETVIDFTGGRGKFISGAEADSLYDSGNDMMIQVDDDLFFAATEQADIEKGDQINHSCDPNCGIKGSLRIAAMRDIVSGEEITFDYAMSESSAYSMVCRCGADNCRKIITGDDWKLELQKRYKGFFSAYIQKRLLKSCKRVNL